MANLFTTPYVDSSFFLAVIKKEAIPCPGGLMRWEVAENILKDAERGEYKLFTSAITIAEVRRIRNRQITLTMQELETVQRFFEHEYIQLIDVTREIAESAQILGATYSINPMDAIHLASAIRWKCDVLLAWDKRFSNRGQGDAIQGVRVIEPDWQGQISSGL